MDEKHIYSLYTILKGIREYLDLRIKGKTFWLKVELADIKFHSSGHCYLELSETKDGKNIAKCKGAIWQGSLETIRVNLKNDFPNIIKKGNEILSLVELQFTEQYGLNIIIKDVDINFSLGALEKKKQETIDQLKRENLIEKNKLCKVPKVIQKIAIIGSAETAGITDLRKQLDNNSYRYHFTYEIFSCLVQGEKAELEIIQRLKQLNGSQYDVIALIRGGGSKLDLEVFNSYNIAREIALHDKPIFTGIGHETDVSVADLVANMYHKTPSALGSYIIEKAHNFEVSIITSLNGVFEYKNRFLEDRKSRLRLNIQTLTSQSRSITQLRRGDLHTKMNRIVQETSQLLNIERKNLALGLELIKTNPLAYIITSKSNLKHTVELIEINSEGRIKQALENFKQIIELIFSYSKHKIEDRLKFVSNILDIVDIYHPDNILTKGYAIPRLNGQLLIDQSIRENDILEIELLKKVLIVLFKKDKQKWKTSLMNRLLKS
jgi:exodeoxyribonuclease VII large subunit